MSEAENKPAIFPKPVIAIVGSANIDLTSYAQILPAAGETLSGDKFSEGFGGKGANQAVISALAGGQVHFIGAVGQDEFGTSLISNFHRYGIHTENVTRLKTHSGTAHIWVDGQGENRIVIIQGANGKIDPSKVAEAIVNIAGLKIVIGQCEIPQAATLAVFKSAKQKGATTILNPAPYQTLSPELLEVTDWLVPNQSEFAQFDPESRLPTSDAIISSLRPAQNLIVTLGESGVAIAQPGKPVIRVQSRKVDVVDSTGAGDCFIGSFATAMGMGLSAEKSAAFAVSVAALSVSKQGAQSSYPSAKEIRRLLELQK